MEVSPLIVLNNVPPGTQTSEEMVISNESKSFILSLSRDNWLDTGEEVVHAGLDISFDEGETWRFLSAFGAYGGEISDVLESTLSSEIPDSPSPPPSPDPPLEPPLRIIRAVVKNFVAFTTTVSFAIQ